MASRQKTPAKAGSSSTKTTTTAAQNTSAQTGGSQETRPQAPGSQPPAAQAPAQAPVKPQAQATGAPSLSIVAELKPQAAGEEIKKKDIIDMVTERSGLKKKDAKPAVEAMIDILGELIAEGRDLNLPPLGKIKHQRTRDTANARIVMLKVRQGKSAGSGRDNAKESVAEDDD